MPSVAERILNNYIYDQERLYWSAPDQSHSFNYSDGDEVELRLLDIIKSSSDLGSTSLELRNQITDWPSQYHLSPRRSNLLRPLSALLHGRILEIGAGCGAITRFIGETGAEVFAVEGSPRRATVAATRCRDLENVNVIADAFHNVPVTPDFDVVTLIGVLEYARMYFPAGTGDPIDQMLMYARRFLKPGGILIVAIENQLGLKYFAGYAEDHVGMPMFGIEDRYSSDSVVTFGRRELQTRISATGLNQQRIWFPFPDYKLPVSVLSDRLLDIDLDIDISPILSNSVACDPQSPEVLMFSLEQAWQPIARNRLFGDLANSFLVVASEQVVKTHNDKILAYHYAVERRPEFAKEVCFEVINNRIMACQRLLFPNEKTSNDLPISIVLKDEVFLSGVHWQNNLIRIVNTQGWSYEDVGAWAEVWFTALLDEAGLSEDRKQLSAHYLLPGSLFDAVPRNLIIVNGQKPKFFDQEWQLDQPIELGYLVFRGVLQPLLSMQSLAESAADTPTRLVELFFKINNYLDINITDADLASYSIFESNLLSLISKSSWIKFVALKSYHLPIRHKIRSNFYWECQLDQLNQQIAGKDQQIAGKDQQIAGKDQQIAGKDQQIVALTDSLSWRITAPLRKVASFCKKKRAKALFEHIQSISKLRQSFRWFLINFSYTFLDKKHISSKVFDHPYYLATNPEVASAGIDPLQHYCTQGWREGRNPHPLFSVAYYLQTYTDVKKSGINPLDHYLLYGWKEGRDPHPVFDSTYYSNAGWYSTKCGMSPLEYYLRYRCAATGIQLAALDVLLPQRQNNFIASLHTPKPDSSQPDIQPLISILMPTYNTPSKYLEATIESVLAQSYLNWELCITDDGSNLIETRVVLEHYSMRDSRIQVRWLEANKGISAATNASLQMAHGEFVTMLDHDDLLEPAALLEFVHELNLHPDTDAIYSDQDLITADGKQSAIYYKPDWSPELMRGVMYVGHLLMVRRSLALDMGGFDSNFDCVQDFEFMLRVGEHTDKIRHIPKILYHWRMIPGSIAENGDAKGKVEPLQCAAVNAHLARLGLAGQANPHPIHAHRAVITPIHNTAMIPSITVIFGQTLKSKYLSKCLDSLSSESLKVDVLLPDSDVISGSRPGITVIPVVSENRPTNNLGAPLFLDRAIQQAQGDYVLFMETPMELSAGWAERLILYAGRPNVMLVSPLVLNTSGTVAEAGLILHSRLGVERAMSGWESDGDGLAGSLSCAREVSAVSAACVFFRRSLINQFGGFDHLYHVADFQLADVALKAVKLGLCNLYVPTVTAKYYAPPPKASPDNECLDRGLFLERWSNSLKTGDRYHNPNYNSDKGGYAIYDKQNWR